MNKKDWKKYYCCNKCLKPKELNTICDHCSSDEDGYTYVHYTTKQWEHFIDSLKGGCAHDFNPWEFDEETGYVNRSYSGHIGPVGVDGEKQPKRLHNNRKLTKGRKKIRNG